MRNPGRRDGDGARPGSIDPTVPQAGSDGGPADDLVGMRVSDAPRAAEPHSADHAFPTGTDDVGGALDGDLDLDADPAEMDDDLLFDPLLSDEPIDLAAVRADDALIDALSGGARAGAGDLADDDPLIAMLAAWAASARPEPAAAQHPTDPDIAATGPAPHLRPVRAAATDEALGVEAAGGHPDVPTPNTGSPGAEASGDGAPDPGSAEQDETDGVTEGRPDLDPPTVRLTGPRRPMAEHRPARPGAVRPSLAEHLPGDHDPPGEPGDGPGGAPRSAATAAAPVVTRLSRVRTAGRRTRPTGQALPAGHPLRRAAVAVVVAALGVSGAAASGGTAQPGDPAWAITKVFFTERARSIEAAQVVSAGLERAQIAISEQRPELAKQELAAISASLLSVREEEGHTRLVDQQRMLEAVAALTPPRPGDPGLTATTTPSRTADPDTSVLAQGTPGAAGKDAAAKDKAGPPVVPPAVAKPAEPTTGSPGATPDSTTGGTTGGTTRSDTTSSGTSGTTSSGTTSSGTTSSGTTSSGTSGTTSSSTTGSKTGAGSVGNDTAPADDATLAAADAGAPPVLPAPAPSLDAARSAGTSETPTDGTTTSESPASSATGAEAGPPAPATPPTADEPAPVTVLGAPEQTPADSPAPVDDQAGGDGSPSAGAAAPKASAAGSAPAVPADAAGPGGTGDAVVPEPVSTVVETGVVPEPVNVVATPTTTTPTTTTAPATETANTPTRDAAADRASSADTPTDTPTHTTSAADTPEPVRATADDNSGPGSSHSESDSGSSSGSGSGSDAGNGSNSGDSGSNNDNSGDSGSNNDASGSDAGGPGGARASAAVSIHP